jgi:hypothetical protein
MKSTKDAQHNPKCEEENFRAFKSSRNMKFTKAANTTQNVKKRNFRAFKSSRTMKFTKDIQHNPKCEEEEF